MALAGHQDEDATLIGPFGVRTDAAEAAEFAAALGLGMSPASIPLTFPIRWLALPGVRAAIEAAIGTPHSVHAAQTFHYDANVEPNRDYAFRVAIVHERTPSQRLVVRGTATDSDDRCVLRLETVLYRTKAVSAAVGSNEYEARTGSLQNIDIGPVEMPHAERYAAAAHDHNRLHSDPDFARSLGLDGPIVHGMMLMGLFQKALSQWRQDSPVSRLSAMFIRPVPLGSRLIIGGRIVSPAEPKGARGQIIRLFVCNERNQIACIGEASIRRDHPSGLTSS